MSDTNINQVLAQMRAMSAAAGGGLEESAKGEGSSPPGVSFAELMQNSLDQVSAAQSKAKELAVAFESGDKNVELPEVMVALQKASISFQAVSEVRNKLLTAYQEVMNMQV